MKRLIGGAALVICSTLMYGHGLAVRPIGADEGQLETQAARLLERQDDRFHWKPLFVRVDGDAWLAPVPVYTTAALMTLVPSASVHARWAAVLFGVADVLLVYTLVVRCVGRVDIGFVAGLALLLTPSHALFSRTAAVEGIWPLPFILMWAIGMVSFVERPPPGTPWTLVAATVSLLASGVAQASAALMIPVFAIASLVMCRRGEGWRPRNVVLASAAAALLLSPLVLIPGGDAGAAETAASLRLIAWQWAATRSNWFWNFFLPSHLFLTPGAQGLCGLFLTATAVPMAAGVYAPCGRSVENEAALIRVRPIIVAACIAGPLTAAVASHPPLDGRALIVVPFGVLLAVQGSIVMGERGRIVGRIVLATVIVGAGIQAILCSG